MEWCISKIISLNIYKLVSQFLFDFICRYILFSDTAEKQNDLSLGGIN